MPARNASRTKKIFTLQPRFWVFAAIAFAVIFAMLYASLQERSAKLKVQEEELLAQKQTLSERVLALKSDLEYARSDAGIEQYARAEGMIMPGEIKYTASVSADE